MGQVYTSSNQRTRLPDGGFPNALSVPIHYTGPSLVGAVLVVSALVELTAAFGGGTFVLGIRIRRLGRRAGGIVHSEDSSNGVGFLSSGCVVIEDIKTGDVVDVTLFTIAGADWFVAANGCKLIIL